MAPAGENRDWRETKAPPLPGQVPAKNPKATFSSLWILGVLVMVLAFSCGVTLSSLMRYHTGWSVAGFFLFVISLGLTLALFIVEYRNKTAMAGQKIYYWLSFGYHCASAFILYMACITLASQLAIKSGEQPSQIEIYKNMVKMLDPSNSQFMRALFFADLAAKIFLIFCGAAFIWNIWSGLGAARTSRRE
jgi:hypothetical protein